MVSFGKQVINSSLPNLEQFCSYCLSNLLSDCVNEAPFQPALFCLVSALFHAVMLSVYISEVMISICSCRLEGSLQSS